MGSLCLWGACGRTGHGGGEVWDALAEKLALGSREDRQGAWEARGWHYHRVQIGARAEDREGSLSS